MFPRITKQKLHMVILMTILKDLKIIYLKESFIYFITKDQTDSDKMKKNIAH